MHKNEKEIIVMGVIAILALIFALGATVMAFIFLVPEKKRANMGKLGKFLHDLVNFRFLIIEKICRRCTFS